MAYDDLHKGASPRLFHFARENRKRATEAEKILWFHLRNAKCRGVKFRRQHPIDNFIADFYCPKARLIIELDGDYHQEIGQTQYDEGRTYELQELNLRVIRFKNSEVVNEIEKVIDAIATMLDQ